MFELCISGHAFSIFLLSSFAQTMNAFLEKESRVVGHSGIFIIFFQLTLVSWCAPFQLQQQPQHHQVPRDSNAWENKSFSYILGCNSSTSSNSLLSQQISVRRIPASALLTHNSNFVFVRIWLWHLLVAALLAARLGHCLREVGKVVLGDQIAMICGKHVWQIVRLTCRVVVMMVLRGRRHDRP